MSAQQGSPRVNPGRRPHPAQVLLAQCVVYLARAPKSVEVYSAYNNVKACLRGHQGPLPPVPLHLRNAPTRLMKDLGYGQGYKYNPAYSEPVEQEYLPRSCGAWTSSSSGGADAGGDRAGPGAGRPGGLLCQRRRS